MVLLPLMGMYTMEIWLHHQESIRAAQLGCAFPPWTVACASLITCCIKGNQYRPTQLSKKYLLTLARYRLSGHLQEKKSGRYSVRNFKLFLAVLEFSANVTFLTQINSRLSSIFSAFEGIRPLVNRSVKLSKLCTFLRTKPKKEHLICFKVLFWNVPEAKVQILAALAVTCFLLIEVTHKRKALSKLKAPLHLKLRMQVISLKAGPESVLIDSKNETQLNMCLEDSYKCCSLKPRCNDRLFSTM